MAGYIVMPVGEEILSHGVKIAYVMLVLENGSRIQATRLGLVIVTSGTRAFWRSNYYEAFLYSSSNIQDGKDAPVASEYSVSGAMSISFSQQIVPKSLLILKFLNTSTSCNLLIRHSRKIAKQVERLCG